VTVAERVLVTGGAGFIGANACNILAASGYAVTALDNLSLGKSSNLDRAVAFVEGDASRIDDLKRAGPVDHVIHLASSSSAPMFLDNLQGSVANNIQGHIAVLEFARACKARKVLFASTSSIYGNNPVPLTEAQPVTPPNFYAVSKHCQEELSDVYHRTHGLEIIGFRFMSVYGLHEEHKGRYANLVSQFIWGVEQGKPPVVYGDGKQTRDFVNVRDVVAAFVLALQTRKTFGFTIFNIGTAQSINIIELVELIGDVMRKRIEPRFIANPVGGYVMNQQADLSKIARELGYAPTISLKQGIAEIVSYRKTKPEPPASLSY